MVCANPVASMPNQTPQALIANKFHALFTLEDKSMVCVSQISVVQMKSISNMIAMSMDNNKIRECACVAEQEKLPHSQIQSTVALELGVRKHHS